MVLGRGIMEVYRELTSIREQIEQLQGRLKLLNDAVLLGTIDLDLEPPPSRVAMMDRDWSATATAAKGSKTAYQISAAIPNAS